MKQIFNGFARHALLQYAEGYDHARAKAENLACFVIPWAGLAAILPHIDATKDHASLIALGGAAVVKSLASFQWFKDSDPAEVYTPYADGDMEHELLPLIVPVASGALIGFGYEMGARLAGNQNPDSLLIGSAVAALACLLYTVPQVAGMIHRGVDALRAVSAPKITP